MQVREGLEQTATGALRRMASALGWFVDDAATHAELVERLTERLSDTAHLADQLRALSDEERAILVEARRSGGELRGLLVERDHPSEADTLVDRGLLFRVFTSSGPRRGEVFALADELAALLPEPALTEPPAAESAPAERRATDPAFSVFCLASALVRGADIGGETRSWSVEPSGVQRWTFLRHIAIGSGLLVHQADGALAQGPTLARLLDDPPAVAERLWRAYLRDRTWAELAHALDVDHELADTVPLREALIGALMSLPEGEWLRLDAVSQWLEQTRPTLVREQLTPRGLLDLDARSWRDLELPLLRYLVLGPLYWLGRVAVSADATLLMRRGPPTRTAFEACTWDGTHLLAPARADLGTLLQAERYLLLRARDRVSQYELLQAHIGAALGSGGSIDECRALLKRLSGGMLPAFVDDHLAAWQQRFGAVHIRPTVVVEARVADELDAALADERVRRLIRARLSDTVAEVAAADALELASALRQTGHLPQVDAGLRLSADARHAYAGLVDQHVLEFLLVSLLAFRTARPESLTTLEGSSGLLERLEHQFPPERLRELRAAAARLAGDLEATPKRARRQNRRRTR